MPPSSLDVTLQHPSAEPSPLTQTAQGEQQPCAAVSPSTLLPVTLQKAASGPYRPLAEPLTSSAQPLSAIDPTQSTLLPMASPRAPSSPPSPSLAASPVSTLAGYELLGIIGRGGMGVVYKARHLRLKRLTAVKMILNSHADSDQRDRFRAEAEAVARLQHPNIVQIYEVGEDQDRPFIALEFVDGGSLDKKLSRPGVAATIGGRVVGDSRAGRGGGAPGRHRPSRPEAGQHPACRWAGHTDRSLRPEDHRLRAGQASGRERGAYPERRHSRHAVLYGSRTGCRQQQGNRTSLGCLRAGHHSLRVPRRPASLHRGHAGGDSRSGTK